MRAGVLTAIVAGLLIAAGSRAAGVDVDIQGLEEEQRDAVRATLQIDEYGNGPVSAAELRAAYKEADQQVRQALEPFGYYDVRVDKSLTGDEASVKQHGASEARIYDAIRLTAVVKGFINLF